MMMMMMMMMSREQQVSRWPSLRAMFGMMIPCCSRRSGVGDRSIFLVGSTTTVTGTIFGHRKGRVNLCVQEDCASPPFLLLELATPTHVLVKEMHSGLLRITLECEKSRGIEEEDLPPLLAEPVWSMYCNGRKVGFAMKRVLNKWDSGAGGGESSAIAIASSLMSVMQWVSSGAGLIPGGGEEGEEVIYMRARYERVVASAHSEALHIMNPDGTPGQELSIFLTRS